MKIKSKLISSLCVLVFSIPSYSQDLKAFKLKNGLSVYIWEDNTKPDVYGVVGVRTGAVDDPDEYTGLAHYLEHMMFKGTKKIGTLNWAEEEPLYNQIIAKYDQMADESDPIKKQEISKEINELSIAASKYCSSSEYNFLMEGMGAAEVNAGTSFDYTTYYSSFPAYQINKWLEISSQIFIDPVFRSFQSELETVYEEYNRSKDNPYRNQSDFIKGKAFEGHPYARSVLGLGEHLKNPRISELINFYNKWYVPENMALIIVGNVNADQIKGRIASTFGRLPKATAPEKKEYVCNEIKGRKQYSAKIGNNPQISLIYPGVPEGHPDSKALTLATAMLSNSSRTGVLDKLVIDGELTTGGAVSVNLRDAGICQVEAIPLYDQNQKRFESNKSAEKKALHAIEQVANGDFEAWILDATKANMCRSYDRNLESNEGKSNVLFNSFIYQLDLQEALDYKEAIMNVSIDDVKRVAKQYLANDYIVINLEPGKTNKEDKIQKPDFAPIEPPVGQRSIYAQQFQSLPIGNVEEKFIDFSDVQIKQINERSKLFYTQNTVNPVFSLTLKYGVGTEKYPNLGIAAQLMNNAGIMGAYEPQELKKELSKLNISCNVYASSDYLNISMSGYEDNLPEACQLLARQIFMPKLDEKQLNRIQGDVLGERMHRKNNPQTLSRALNQYVFYGNESPFIKEVSDKSIYELLVSSLTGDINRASNYEAEIYYTGNLPFENVYEILSNNLPLVANEQVSESPNIKPFAKVEENTVYFLPNNDVEQAQIVFFMPTANYEKKDNVVIKAFQQYLSGGFNGLLMEELREKRSMAYTVGAYINTPELVNYPTALIGSIGTQNDKAIEALTLYMDILRNMPNNPERIDNIKSYLKQIFLTSQPGFRYKANYFENIKKIGYNEDPAIENIPLIEALTFDDILNYYNENIKDKPIAIGIMGNSKNIDMEDLKKFGKVVRLNEKRLFNTKDTFF